MLFSQRILKYDANYPKWKILAKRNFSFCPMKSLMKFLVHWIFVDFFGSLVKFKRKDCPTKKI